MADSKLDALTEDTAPADGDLVYLEHDPGGTPADRKGQLQNLPAQVGADLYNAANFL